MFFWLLRFVSRFEPKTRKLGVAFHDLMESDCNESYDEEQHHSDEEQCTTESSGTARGPQQVEGEVQA